MTFARVITPKEQYEAWLNLAEYLRLVGDHAPEAVQTLLAEFYRHTLHTMRSAFAPLMPPESIARRPQVQRQVTRTAPELYIPLEDIRDGWGQSGDIAQELYGAGMALTFAAHAYVSLRPGLTVYSAYPLLRWDAVKFTLGGTPDYEVPVALLGDLSGITDSDGRAVLLTAIDGGVCYRARGGETYLVS